MEIKLILVLVVAFCSVVLAQNDDNYEYDYYWPGDANSASAADDSIITGDKPPVPDNNDHFYEESQENLDKNENDDIEEAVGVSAIKSEDKNAQDTDTKVNEEIEKFLGDVDADLGQDGNALDENDYQVEDNRPVLGEGQIKSDEDEGFQLEIAQDSEIPSPDTVIETKDLLEDIDSEMDINVDMNDLGNNEINNKDEVKGLKSEEFNAMDAENPIEDANLGEMDLESKESKAMNKEDPIEDGNSGKMDVNDENNDSKNNANFNEDENESLEPDDINAMDEQDHIKNANISLNQKSKIVKNENDFNAENSADENDQADIESNSDESIGVGEDKNRFWYTENEGDNQDENKFEANEEKVIEKEDDDVDDDNIEEDLQQSIKELNSIFDDLARSEDNFEKDDFEDDSFDDNSALIEEEKNGRPFREEYVLGLRDQLLNDEANINDESFIDEINENDQNDVDDLDLVVDNDVVAEPIPYLNDAIYGENKADIVNDTDILNNEDIESDDSEVVVDHVDQLLDLVKEAQVLLSPNLDNLTNSELEDLDRQFSVDHKEELDVESENFDRNVAPILMNLELGVPVVVTSPNYPEPYPTNNIVDWIFEGKGMGIELNITDLSLNGFLGDYLLVKPGGIDESGHEGLLFSYQLRSERRYRFLDVNRLFVRFEALPGTAFNGGFSYSVKLLSPLPDPEETMPEPEPVVTLPDETLLVFLGGVTTEEFANITDDFQLIVADMATLYTNANGIDTGNVTIADVTHITMVKVCHITWPGFERCTGVRFGVQLDDATGLTEAQLGHMWRGYVDQDPFASRLRRLGVTEFAVPNDSTTLMVWLVIGVGVAISAGMLGLALWRWTCYDEYTRMPTFNDTDSIISDKKKPLDLYPTPHQTLPPLYTDEYIKYEDSARVDMGGFANQSYTRDVGLYDIESDDDIGALPGARQHRNTIQPKDIY